MADSLYPPGNLVVSGGVWGVAGNVHRDTTIYLSGDSSVLFNVTPGLLLLLCTPQAAAFPCKGGDAFVVDAWFRSAALMGAGDGGVLRILWYNAAWAYVDASYPCGNPITVAATNTWERKTGSTRVPASAVWGVLQFGGTSVNFNSNMWWDSVVINMMSVAFMASRYYPAVQDIPSGIATTVTEIASEAYDYGSNYDTASSTFTAPATGVYSFHATVHFFYTPPQLVAGTLITISIVRTGPILDYLGEMVIGAAKNCRIVGGISGVALNVGDTVQLQVQHDAGVTCRTVSVRFQGIRVQ